MTVSSLVTEISKRLNDENNIMFSTSLIKSYLFKSISIVFLSDLVGEDDYFGLFTSTSSEASNIDIGEAVKKVLYLKDSRNYARYIRKTIGQIEALTGIDYLEPQTGERFYYIVGNTVKLYGSVPSDTSVTVYYIKYPEDSYADAFDLSTIFSNSFIELATRDTINTIIKEIDVRS